jgi:hypothetical protein
MRNTSRKKKPKEAYSELNEVPVGHIFQINRKDEFTEWFVRTRKNQTVAGREDDWVSHSITPQTCYPRTQGSDSPNP